MASSSRHITFAEPISSFSSPSFSIGSPSDSLRKSILVAAPQAELEEEEWTHLPPAQQRIRRTLAIAAEVARRALRPALPLIRSSIAHPARRAFIAVVHLCGQSTLNLVIGLYLMGGPTSTDGQVALAIASATGVGFFMAVLGIPGLMLELGNESPGGRWIVTERSGRKMCAWLGLSTLASVFAPLLGLALDEEATEDLADDPAGLTRLLVLAASALGFVLLFALVAVPFEVYAILRCA